MAIGMIGRKCGMTRVFTDAGASVPVSVIEALPNRIAAVRASEQHGYSALQVTTGSKKASRLSKAEAGHFAKCGIDAGRGLWEFRTEGESGDWEVGGALTVDMFEEGQKVDVTGSTIGKGFAGAVKRHNFRTQDATHGNSLAHRAPGSIGQCQTPGRVFKGKKMAGHMGDVKRTAVNLEVVRVDTERNLILIRGAVPGAKGGDVVIHPSIKSPKKG